jgi:PhnB protein
MEEPTMAIDPIPDGPRITPYLLYEDVGKALEWLAKAFGFEELGERLTGADGKVGHAAMRLGNGQIMLGRPGPTYKNPKRLGQATQHLYVFTENVDALFSRARAMGAAVIEEPKDTPYGDRRCGIADPEGHQWFFAQRVREVSREEPRRSGAASSK